MSGHTHTRTHARTHARTHTLNLERKPSERMMLLYHDSGRLRIMAPKLENQNVEC